MEKFAETGPRFPLVRTRPTESDDWLLFAEELVCCKPRLPGPGVEPPIKRAMLLRLRTPSRVLGSNHKFGSPKLSNTSTPNSSSNVLQTFGSASPPPT